MRFLPGPFCQTITIYCCEVPTCARSSLPSELHGRKSFAWNQEEECRGRQVWSGCAERRIRSSRHFWTTLNYVHHNPVRHGYVKHWQEWPYSSAEEYLDKMEKEEAARIWRDFPLLEYGKGWDDPEL